MNYTYYAPNEDNAPTTETVVNLHRDWGWDVDIDILIVAPEGYEMTDRDYREIDELLGL